jgi:MFS family permease
LPGTILRYSGAIAASAQVLGCLFAGSLIQAFGRGIIWIISLATIAVTDLILSVSQEQSSNDKFPRWIAIFVMFINMLAFGIGAGPIPWFNIPEMFPPAVRPAATSIGVLSNWIFTFTVIVTFPPFSEKTNKWGVFLFFAIISFAGVIFGFFYVKDPETEQMKEDSLGTAIYDGLDSQ